MKEPVVDLKNEGFITIENLHKLVYVLHYRNRFRPSSVTFVANDINDARERGLAYCKKYGLKYISVHHFFADLMKAPADAVGTFNNTD